MNHMAWSSEASWVGSSGCGTLAEPNNVMSDMYASVHTWKFGSSGSVSTLRNHTRCCEASTELVSRRSRGTIRMSHWAHSSTKTRWASSRSSIVGTSISSGPTTRGIESWCSMPSWSTRWKEADMEKIGSPSWMAVTRRVAKLRPSRRRSTWKTVGTSGMPGRMKYPCREWTCLSESTVRTAATRV